jgi:hypothetical protein
MELKKNIIIVGGSYCKLKESWPLQVANNLGLNLIHFSLSACHWWNIRHFLISLSEQEKNASEVIIYCHPNSINKLPLENRMFNLLKKNPPKEFLKAKELYDKHFNNIEFNEWAEIQWYKEFSDMFKNIKIINLHGLGTTKNRQYLQINFVYLLLLLLNPTGWNQ